MHRYRSISSSDPHLVWSACWRPLSTCPALVNSRTHSKYAVSPSTFSPFWGSQRSKYTDAILAGFRSPLFVMANTRPDTVAGRTGRAGLVVFVWARAADEKVSKAITGSFMALDRKSTRLNSSHLGISYAAL